MGMSNKVVRSAWAAGLGVLLLVVGLGSLLWVTFVLPSFWWTAMARDAAALIVANERFKAGALTVVLAKIQGQPAAALSKSDIMRAVALVRLRRAEEMMARNSSEEVDREIATAEAVVRSALVVNPTDAFIWLKLYSVQTTRNGFDPKNVSLLIQSYATGPNEGWIAVRRNRLALGVFSTLSRSAQDTVAHEFAQLVESDFTDEAATNLMGVGWANRGRLLEALTGVDVVSKNGLSRRLRVDGIEVKVPGIELEGRPWQ